MEKEQYLEWLNTLQVGDEVGVIEEIEGIGHTINYSSAKITNINENRAFVLSTGTSLDQMGEYRYQEQSLGNIFHYKMIPLTDDIKKKSRFSHINKMIGLLTGGGPL
ncbi:hypothetical protein RFW18_17105 [Metabacillus idriensis]|uniref:hypothetical protein n=1 Tax=Metabacillus idriensis TaxID=324768 RepID=UPI0028133E91|nr:hypothetical protein [Metabacillus idriensis]MDR0139476.1 hypothetical protein [Metabacillus idriensis]